jgi:hypothetical protein
MGNELLICSEQEKSASLRRKHTTQSLKEVHKWLGSFGHAGTGKFRAELRRALVAIQS